MINQLLIEELFMSPLCVELNYAHALAMSAYYAYSGNKPLSNSKYVKSYSINAASGEKQSTESTPGSVGLVTIDGPIVSASDPWYGIKGTIEAAQELLALEADPNIIGSVLFIESGGGAVYALKPIVDVLNSLQKPVVTFTKQILASAAYRIGANTDYIMMYHPHGIVGSLGTMYSSSDIQPMLEKWGMTFQEYYATESTMKNKTFNDAKKGDGTALINNILNPMNDQFLGDIKALRGHKIDSSVKTIYQGETYLADPQGVKLGLIDGMGTLQEAVAMVVDLANGGAQSSLNSNFKKSNTNMALFNKFPKVGELAKAAAGTITADQLKAANQELEAEGVKGVTLCLDSELEGIDAENKKAVATQTENTNALAAINALLGTGNEKQTLSEALEAYSASANQTNESLTAVTKERDSWKAKAIEFGAKPAEEHTSSPQKETDEIEGANKPNPFYSQADEDLKQMRAAAGLKPKAPKK